MEFLDLYRFPPGHPPSPFDHAVEIVRDRCVGVGLLPSGLALCAVGWLERMGFPTGEVPQACIDALIAAHAKAIISDGTHGWHEGTLCDRRQPPQPLEELECAIELRGRGHYLVLCDGAVYMAPELLLHYILKHHYCPPQEFVDAVLRGRFITVGDLDFHWRFDF
jgi:hypothetical protein